MRNKPTCAAQYDMLTKEAMHGGIFRYNISPRILVGANLTVKFEKEQDADEVARGLPRNLKAFGVA